MVKARLFNSDSPMDREIDNIYQELKSIGGTYPNLSSGAGAPSSTPSQVGDIYIDTTSKREYKAYGTSSSADWLLSSRVFAWVNFNGTGTVSIRDSYNVSSITDNGTGYYTVNFTIAAPNTNYAVLITLSPIYGSSQSIAQVHDSGAGGEIVPSTSSFSFSTRNMSQVNADVKYINVLVMSN